MNINIYKINEKKINYINNIKLLFEKFDYLLIFNINKINTTDLNILRKNFFNKNIKIFYPKKSILKKYLILNKLNNILDLNNIENQFIIFFFKNDSIFYVINNISLFIKKNNLGKIELLFFNNKIYKNDCIEIIKNSNKCNDIIIKLIYLIKKISILNILYILKYILEYKNLNNN